jgi:hypothetical protein
VQGHPITNFVCVETSSVQAHLKAAMAEISPPVDKLKAVTHLGKIFDVLAIAYVAGRILRVSAH